MRPVPIRSRAWETCRSCSENPTTTSGSSK
jgi:hypothetical protein